MIYSGGVLAVKENSHQNQGKKNVLKHINFSNLLKIRESHQDKASQAKCGGSREKAAKERMGGFC